MKKIYGYVRTSTNKQKVDRQIKNILAVYPNARIIVEKYTGTTMERKEWNKLYDLVKRDITNGDEPKIVFDEVSRMARNKEEGYQVYMKLFDLGVSLEFLKEDHVNTDTFRETLKTELPMTGTEVDIILEAVKKYLMELARKQIYRAFEKANDEVDYLRTRTKEALDVLKDKGIKLGRAEGSTYETKKSIKAKELIKKNSSSFNGHNTDVETMAICGISSNTYYKYKKEIMAELYNI